MNIPEQSSTQITQLGMNLKALIPELGQETIITTTPPGWKDTKLKVGSVSTDKNVTITYRAFGKALAHTALNDEPFRVEKDRFMQIIAATMGRERGSDRRIMARVNKDNAQEVQYSSLMNAVEGVMGSILSPAQKNALTLWIAVVLQDAARMVRWGGPIDIILSRVSDRIIATDKAIRTEHLVWTYINLYESRVKPALSGLLPFLTEKVGYYDVQAIAEHLFIQWNTQQIEVHRDKAVFMSRESQFRQTVLYLLKGLPTVPDPLSSTADLAEFLKLSNYLIDINLTGNEPRKPQSFAEARSFIITVRAMATSPNTKIEIVPTLSFQRYFQVVTTTFKSGVDGSDLRDISLNYAGADTIRAGEMIDFAGDYKQWSEDPALSSTLSAITRALLSSLDRITDIRLETWASVVDNLSDINIWVEDTEDGKRLIELRRAMKAYALAAASWLTRDLKGWVYGLLSPGSLSMSASDAAFTLRGATTRRPEIAVALSLIDKPGDPFIGNPTPFYKADHSSYLQAIEGEHYRVIRQTMDDGQTTKVPLASSIPSIAVQAIETDGTTFSTAFPFSSLVSGAYPTTRAMLNNIALIAKIEHIKGQLNESLRFDKVLTAELIVPMMREITKIATDAFGNLVEGEILNFDASMSSVKKNYFRVYTTLNCINILIALCKFIEPELSKLLDTLYTFVLSDRETNRIILGVL
jgi:hypothetical protein